MSARVISQRLEDGLGRSRRRGHSDFVLLHPAVEGAAAEAEGFGRLADVAAEAPERLLDEEALDLFEAHLFEAALAAAAAGLEAEVGRLHLVGAREEHGALDDVVQLSHVPGP